MKIAIPVPCCPPAVFSNPVALCIVETGNDNGMVVGSIILAYVLGFALLGVGTILSLFLTFLSLVAQTRWVAHDSLSSAFEFGEVWRWMRDGLNNYLLAFAVWYGGTILASMLVMLLMYTIVLACLYPLLLGVVMTYAMLLMGSFYGMAYYHTQAGLAEAEAAA